MGEIPLPGLQPNNPENSLSVAARHRIQRAYREAEIIRTRALADLDVRYRSEPNPVRPFSEYLDTGQAALDWKKALMESARVILATKLAEFRAVRKSGRELQHIMDEQIEGVVNSYELSTAQRDLLRMELDLHNIVGQPASGPEHQSATTRVKPHLSDQSLAEIAAVKAEAASDLLSGLSQHWEVIPLLEIPWAGRHPSDLMPVFEAYAERQYDAYANEWLPHFSDVNKYAWHLAAEVTDTILKELQPKLSFRPDDLLSGDWTDLARLVTNGDPELRKQLETALSCVSGDWEIYVGRSFLRHLVKQKLIGLKKSNDLVARAQTLQALFQLKYQFHLRLFANWYNFDLRIRAHLSNRLAFWTGTAYRRLAENRQNALPKTPSAQGELPADGPSAEKQGTEIPDERKGNGPGVQGGVSPTKADTIAARAAKRQAVVAPILQRRRWTRGRLATEAGLGKNSVYEYLDGTRSKITAENRKAIAGTLDISEEQLPD